MEYRRRTAIDHTSQNTTRLLKPEEATLDELYAFIDRVEFDASEAVRTIAGHTSMYNRGFAGEAYYLGKWPSCSKQLGVLFLKAYAIIQEHPRGSRRGSKQSTVASMSRLSSIDWHLGGLNAVKSGTH